jgi:hypothetical protein
LILHSIIVFVFFVFAIRYLIRNSLSKKEQRLQSFKSAILAIYYIPIFIQGLSLLYTSIIYFYFVVKEFSYLLFSFIYKNEYADFSSVNLLYFMSAICFGSLLLSFHVSLAKISANNKIDVDAVAYKICYCILSAFLLRVLYLNLPLFNPLALEFSTLYFFSNSIVIIIFSLISIVLLLLPIFLKTNNKSVLYARLSLKVSIAYFVLSFLLAFIIFLLYLSLKLIRA